MASGLQCPGCGHVHPSGLPEIVRGDTTFRCYGCYRTLSVPEGWSGRPSPRPAASAPASAGVADAPPGSGTRDARAARLAARRAARAGVGQVPIPGAGPGAAADTQMVSTVGPDGGASPDPRSAPGTSSAGRDWSAAGSSSAGRDWSAAGSSSAGRDWSAGGAYSAQPNSSGAGAGAGDGVGGAATAGARGRPGARAPLGWVAPRRSGRPVPTPIRALVWAVAFGVALAVTVFVLKAVGLLDVNTAIDIYAGSGVHRFAVLLVMLPVWALLSATIAHFSLEALARHRLASIEPAAGTAGAGGQQAGQDR